MNEKIDNRRESGYGVNPNYNASNIIALNSAAANTEETEIDLVEVFRALVSKIWLIILLAALGAGLMLGYTMLFVKPTYSSTSTIYILTKSTSITSLADIQLGTQITKDYQVIITSRPVIEEVINNLSLDKSYEGLKSQISINNPDNTRFLEITVKDTDAYLAKKIVDELTDVSVRTTGVVMDTTPPNIMDYGQVASSPVSPSVKKNAIIGALLGIVLACAIIIIRFMMNDSIRTGEDVEKYLGLNVLGMIPLEEGTSKRKTHGKDRDAAKRRKAKSSGKSSDNDGGVA